MTRSAYFEHVLHEAEDMKAVVKAAPLKGSQKAMLMRSFLLLATWKTRSTKDTINALGSIFSPLFKQAGMPLDIKRVLVDIFSGNVSQETEKALNKVEKAYRDVNLDNPVLRQKVFTEQQQYITKVLSVARQFVDDPEMLKVIGRLLTIGLIKVAEFKSAQGVSGETGQKVQDALIEALTFEADEEKPTEGGEGGETDKNGKPDPKLAPVAIGVALFLTATLLSVVFSTDTIGTWVVGIVAMAGLIMTGIGLWGLASGKSKADDIAKDVKDTADKTEGGEEAKSEPASGDELELIGAVKAGEVSKVDELIKKGAKADARDDQDLTALHHAARLGDQYTEVLKALLAAGADVNSIGGSDKQTPLIRAIYGQHKETINLLLADSKIEVNKTNGDGKTALDYAQAMNLTDVIDLLKQKGAQTGAPAA